MRRRVLNSKIKDGSELPYIVFTNEGIYSGSIFLTSYDADAWYINIYYSTDGNTWSSRYLWGGEQIYFTVPAGGKLYIKTNESSLNGDSSTKLQFSGNIPHSCYGNIMSLIGGADPKIVPENCFRALFAQDYNLLTAPALPATTVKRGGYYGMFDNCTSLNKAPLILPAKNIDTYSYALMFSNCTSLEVAPIISDVSYAQRGLYYMFQNCSKLNYIKCLFSGDNTQMQNLATNWVMGVSSTGTFVKNSSAKWNVVGDSGVPNGWTIK